MLTFFTVCDIIKFLLNKELANIIIKRGVFIYVNGRDRFQHYERGGN